MFGNAVNKNIAITFIDTIPAIIQSVVELL